MSVEALVEAIEAEAAAEAESLLAEADARVAARLAAAEAAARSRVEAALAAAEPAILGAEARAVNEARLRLASLRAARLAAGTEAAFAIAEDTLSSIARGDCDPARWEAAIRRLAAEATALIGSGELHVRPGDVAAAAVVAGMPGREALTVVADPAMAPGVRGRSADGRVTVDATIPGRMRQARAMLVPQVAARLREAGPESRPLVGARA